MNRKQQNQLWKLVALKDNIVIIQLKSVQCCSIRIGLLDELYFNPDDDFSFSLIY